jgi:hypothetical protein
MVRKRPRLIGRRWRLRASERGDLTPGFVLPDIQKVDLSFPTLMSGLIIGSVGLFLFLFGKRAERPLPLFIGLAMCVYPYFIPNLIAVWLLTAILLVPVWAYRHG